ncbi:MAG: hypothetical protein RLZZ283_352 [Candidatus Parcubacteria bacterium]
MREQERLDRMSGKRRRKENIINAALRGPTMSRAFFYAERRRRLRESSDLSRFFKSVQAFYAQVSVADPSVRAMIENLMHGADLIVRRAAAIAIGADTVELFKHELSIARQYLEGARGLIAANRERKP